MELIFKNGNVELAEHIPHKNENMGKVRLTRNGDTEGIWVMFSDADKKKYDDDSLYGETVIAALCNQSLAGVPWGAYVKVTLDGVNRPTCVCEEIFGDDPTFFYPDWASEKVCEHFAQQLQANKYKLDDDMRAFLIPHIANAPESEVTAALTQLLEQ
jgi:hypothetical protein